MTLAGPVSQTGGVTLPSMTTCPALSPPNAAATDEPASQARQFIGCPIRSAPTPSSRWCPSTTSRPRSVPMSSERQSCVASLAQHRRGMEHLIGDQRRHAELEQLAVAVLDDLDAGDQLADRIGGLLRRARAGRQIAGEAHRELALHAGTDKVGEPNRGTAAVDVAGRHEPGGRAAQPEVFLHPPRGRADLEATRRGRADAMRQRALHRRALGLGARRDVGGQRGDLIAALPSLMQCGGGRFGLVGHARLVSS